MLFGNSTEFWIMNCRDFLDTVVRSSSQESRVLWLTYSLMLMSVETALCAMLKLFNLPCSRFNVVLTSCNARPFTAAAPDRLPVLVFIINKMFVFMVPISGGDTPR